ncbi:hypothetical protein [Vibrio tarriae]|uniref:hypothetical protein n=1 Tax=Vibrio tarriae TaxID=2014742 RepID=UPI0011BF035C|nr:hypothetical protein [Vibrio tarriae]
MVMVVVFEFGVMRCQPLRRALGRSKVFQLSISRGLKVDFGLAFFSAVMSGVLIFVLQNLILKLAIEPAKEFKKQIVLTSIVLLENMPKISNASASEEISNAISKQSAFLLAECELIMGYRILKCIYRLPSKKDLLSACHNLNVLSHNMKPTSQEFYKSPDFNGKARDLASENNRLLRDVSKLLKVSVTFEPTP